MSASGWERESTARVFESQGKAEVAIQTPTLSRLENVPERSGNAAFRAFATN
jgi:hypothetical protein